jgi:clan AA aspartic protease (TIGR02281 family)
MTQIRLSLPQAALDNVIVLNVRLNERTLVPMLLDTGAKYTVITSNVARRLEIDIQSRGRNVSVVTASQLTRVPLVSLDRVDVHGVALPDIEAVVTDLPAALGVEGLLGMSFLKQCRLVLDGPSRYLEISKEPG